jgi:hypothetical protein
MPFFAYLFLGIRKTLEEEGERLVGERPDLFGAGLVDTHYYYTGVVVSLNQIEGDGQQ